ncbi:hypothetical protein Y032_0440g1510 [Ancylostoma ceylanicum]|uniref:Uncharacterized protein n=1 Tax=Ancylostoma ceylanicum TaxID=53326 RepID=A0A016WZK3_9BILA|nr:hypothetical protein Y032_0440g1510 [Ancylostoma ceylanicum]
MGLPMCEVRLCLVRVSPNFATTVGDRDTDKVKEETPDERGDELRLAVIHGEAVDTYHFYDPYLLYRRFILIHFEMAKSGDTLMWKMVSRRVTS